MEEAAKNALMAGASSLPDHLREQAAANPNSDIRAQSEGMTSERKTVRHKQGAKGIPEIGIVVCNSWSSNTGSLTGEAALRVIKKTDDVVLFSLPAMATEVARQLYLAREIMHLVVMDGCRNRCAQRIIEGLGINYDAYLNVEFDIGIEKLGPFTTFQYSKGDITRVAAALKGIIEEIRKKGRKEGRKNRRVAEGTEQDREKKTRRQSGAESGKEGKLWLLQRKKDKADREVGT